jgi:predicted 3-demethylubiquinone-9 3-methyltransferase (glyoxalase superfamily)
MSATFQLDGQEFFALNGGPHFTFSKDPAKSAKVMQAMMKMDKLDIQRLHQAYDQK